MDDKGITGKTIEWTEEDGVMIKEGKVYSAFFFDEGGIWGLTDSGWEKIEEITKEEQL